MGDMLKEIWEAANNRIRSPFVGSIIFVFLAVNWRPLFNLLFGEKEVLVRLAHFDNVTTWVTLYAVPIVGGVAFALASPWLQHVGALWARLPNAKLKNLQDETAHQHQIAEIRRATELEETRAAEEEARERRKIEAAKREKEAEEIGGEELVERVQAKTGPYPIEVDRFMPRVSERANDLLSRAADHPSGEVELVESDNGEKSIAFGDEILQFESRRVLLEAQEAISELTKEQYIEGMNPWQVTALGYRYLDNLSA